MKVLGVIDLLHGRAVHARAGLRERYAPVTAVGAAAIRAGDAVALAKSYIALGVRELYLADLDAILRRPHGAGSSNHTRLVRLAALGVPLWLDAGIASAVDAAEALAAGAARVIVGLETLPSYAALEDICAAAGRDRVAFSLDLRNGEPIGAPGGAVTREPVLRIAERAAAAGVRTMIVLDLARVGTSRLLDVPLMANLRRALPGVALLAGGGISGLVDIERLRAAGCEGVLVATALHDGRLGRSDLAAAQDLGRAERQGSGRR